MNRRKTVPVENISLNPNFGRIIFYEKCLTKEITTQKKLAQGQLCLWKSEWKCKRQQQMSSTRERKITHIKLKIQSKMKSNSNTNAFCWIAAKRFQEWWSSKIQSSDSSAGDWNFLLYFVIAASRRKRNFCLNPYFCLRV